MAVQFKWLVILAALVLAQGCSKANKTIVDETPDPFFYSFVAEDANIVGLVVTDNNGTVASESSPGVYEFAENYTPVTPITFVSNNLNVPGSTFQDIDGSGDRTNADIDYNVGFNLNYIGAFQTSDAREIFANPVTALIPANGIPSAGIAGLPESVLQAAFTDGVAGAADTIITLEDGTEISQRRLIARSSALITAIQEGIAALNSDSTTGQSAALQLASELSDANLSVGLDDLTQFSTSAQSAIELSVDSTQTELVVGLADAIAQILVDSASFTFTESVILTVQKSVTSSFTLQDVAAFITAARTLANDRGVQFAVKLAQEIEASGGLDAFMQSLVIVPIDVGNNGMSLVDAQVNDFNMSYSEDDGVVTINAVNAFFHQAELQYFFEDDLYGAAVNELEAILISLNANETNFLGAASEGINSARLLAVCWRDSPDENSAVCGEDNENLEFYALATVLEVCDAEYDSAFIAEINSLNRLDISCN